VIAIAAAEKANNACGLAMVTAPEPNKLEFLTNRFGKTEGGLDRLCAARKQLDVCDAFRQQSTHQVEKIGAGLGREAAERNAFELLLYAFDIVGVAMTETADPNASDEIEVLLPVDVGDRATPGVVDSDL
jgi:hypothetical protein